MSPTPITIAPEVAQVIGPERERAIRADKMLATGTCPFCRTAVDRQYQAAVVVIRFAYVETGQRAAHINLAHSTCSPSRCLELTPEQVAAEQAQAAETRGDGLGGCTMMTTLAIPGRRPVVLIRFDKTYQRVAAGGDSIDLVAELLLTNGWHLVTQWEIEPPGVDGWQLHWHPTGSDPTGPAQVSITTPGDELLADAMLTATDAWLQAATTDETVAVYYTPLPLHTWTDGIDDDALAEAIRDGRVIGGQLAASIRRQH